jgi:hypothetical protein
MLMPFPLLFNNPISVNIMTGFRLYDESTYDISLSNQEYHDISLRANPLKTHQQTDYQ